MGSPQRFGFNNPTPKFHHHHPNGASPSIFKQPGVFQHFSWGFPPFCGWFHQPFPRPQFPQFPTTPQLMASRTTSSTNARTYSPNNQQFSQPWVPNTSQFLPPSGPFGEPPTINLHLLPRAPHPLSNLGPPSQRVINEHPLIELPSNTWVTKGPIESIQGCFGTSAQFPAKHLWDPRWDFRSSSYFITARQKQFSNQPPTIGWWPHLKRPVWGANPLYLCPPGWELRTVFFLRQICPISHNGLPQVPNTKVFSTNCSLGLMLGAASQNYPWGQPAK